MGLYLFSGREEGFAAWADTRDNEVKLETKDEVYLETLDSLRELVKASNYFDWDLNILIETAKAQLNQKESE